MEKIKVFETFSGIGAQHKALDILKQNNYINYEVVGTSEWDIWANIAYNAIHNKNIDHTKNISEKEINDFLIKFTHSRDSKTPLTNEQVIKLPIIIKQNLYNSIKNSNNLGSIVGVTGNMISSQVGKIDLLTYSFPCQDLSTAGSFHGKNQGMKKNSGTRSGLLWEIERILKELKAKKELPKYLLLENVNNMISERHKDDYLMWLDFLNSIGYNTQTYVLEANKYGCPQNRKRVFALSVRKDVTKEFKDTFLESKRTSIKEEKTPFDISKEIGIYKKTHELLREDYSIEKYKNEAINAIPNRTDSRKRIFLNNKMLSTQENTNIEKHSKNIYIQNGKTYSNFSSTITTKQDRDPNGGIINLKGTDLQNRYNEKKQIRKANFRLLTPRECYMLMGFSENDFDKVLSKAEQINFSVSVRKKTFTDSILYRQSGNSISVNVLTSIFKVIADIENKTFKG
ncbi:deoxycytosine methylase [Mesoplasma florum L1]|uniref:Cytosine-specific methyltransferase n=1 Tax=Mesoplasma florum (strain ATCC 33453 / NBRC 100688 / NCTC 11704 / L1) TaxID=265311 RepID=Q6F1G2_MESFL|nr:DNA (cytosine-5-)-methyltransferase [Mesoplasma florum]AAT75661.1 deoxycytosine methylase [Mesoplasma florum L1]